MSDLGALLRKAREQRGYTLDDIQDITKIRKRYLEAIETGDYKVLPGSFYVRAFVKTYAETVGLDAEEVLRLYQKELPKPAAAESAASEPRIKPSRRSVQHNDRWGKVSVTLLLWLFPILIVAVIYVYLSQNQGGEPNEVDPNKITQETGTPTPSPTMSSSPSAPSTQSAPPSVSESPSPSPVTFTDKGVKSTARQIEVAPAGSHQLQLEFTGDCWIDVKENNRYGKVIYSKGIKAAETPMTLTYDLSQPLYVNVGRADNVKITIDGQLFDDGDKANRARFVFIPATTESP